MESDGSSANIEITLGKWNVSEAVEDAERELTRIRKMSYHQNNQAGLESITTHKDSTRYQKLKIPKNSIFCG